MMSRVKARKVSGRNVKPFLLVSSVLIVWSIPPMLDASNYPSPEKLVLPASQISAHTEIPAEAVYSPYMAGFEGPGALIATPLLTEMEINPMANSVFKAYMDFKMITNTGSKQWEFQQEACTDEQGFRRIGEDYMIAVGTYYADQIGDRLQITLEGGRIFTALVGDFKSDAHTNPSKQYALADGSMVEFIVEVNKLDSMVRKMGDASHANFQGAVIKIEKIE